MIRALLPALASLALAAAAQAQTAPQAPSPQALPVSPPPVVVKGIVDQPCGPDNKSLGLDWARLCTYAAANAALPPPQPGRPRVVFMGDSITQNWVSRDPAFFATGDYVGRGISGQTTPQMLVRFMPDVIALKPAVVHIMAGTNDIAGNTGPTTYQAVQDNIAAMATLARANGIRVILASVPPAYEFPWSKGLEPAPKVARLNAWIKAYAAREGFTFVDYGPVLADEKGGVRADLAEDGIHPTLPGYQAMAPLAQAAIRQALRSRR